MFDVGFWELTVIAIVALLVIGPERLPSVARTVGLWLGKLRGFVSSVQTDINREIGKSEELKRLLDEQSKIKETHEIIEKTIGEVGKPVPLNASVDKNNVKDEPNNEFEKANILSGHNTASAGSNSDVAAAPQQPANKNVNERT